MNSERGLSEKEIETFRSTLEETKRRVFQRKVIEDRKIWAHLDESYTFRELLNRLTKEELLSICSSLELTGMSAFKKSELIDGLEEKFSERLPQLFLLFDESRYKTLKRMVQAGGRTYFPTTPEELVYFRRRGLIFTGTIDDEKVLITPPEVLEAFRQQDIPSYRERVRKNTELIQFTQGLLFYYGTLLLVEYKEMLHYHFDESYHMIETIRVLEEAKAFNHTFRLDSFGLSEQRVVDPEKIKAEHRARPELPFYPFTKAQLVRAGEADYVERNYSFRAFVQFLTKNYVIEKEEAELIVEECVDGIKMDVSIQEQIDYLQTSIEIAELETLNQIVAHLVELTNNTKQWILKGYAPYEIAPRKQVQSEPKVGRNSICSCGSGKKFKKCCGNT